MNLFDTTLVSLCVYEPWKYLVVYFVMWGSVLSQRDLPPPCHFPMPFAAGVSELPQESI